MMMDATGTTEEEAVANPLCTTEVVKPMRLPILSEYSLSSVALSHKTVIQLVQMI